MRPDKVDVAIVGGGIAGAAAADVLGARGVSVLVLDDNRHPGGQYLRGGRGAGGLWADGARRRGLALLERLGRGSVAVRRRTETLGIEPDLTLIATGEDGAMFAVRPSLVLLATGARERFLPFLGWTLPGVISTGAAQILIKQSGILPARETLVAGAGLFPAAVAGDIAAHGGRVPALFDEMPAHRRIPHPALLARHAPKFLQGAAILLRLLASGTALRAGTRVVEARGGERLREIVTARVDREGALIPGSEKTHPAECLAVGHGFAANTELAQLAGCEIVCNARLGGWVVRVDENLETSVAGVFAAGELTAVGGAVKSLTEGRLAGYGMLRLLGLLRPGEETQKILALKRTRSRQLAFARWFNAQWHADPERLGKAYGGLADEVPVCRCENVNIGALRRAAAEGFATAAGVKKATRCGMGVCQGATCKTILLDALAALTGRPPELIPPPTTRFPVKPVTLGALAGADD